MNDIILLGIGGHAHSVIDSIEQARQYCIAGFLDTKENLDKEYRGYHVLGTDDMLETYYQKGIRNAFVTVGYLGKGSVRQKLYAELKRIGYTIPNIIDKRAVLAKNVYMGEGIYIGKQAVVNANANIGSMCIINTGAIIEHDCSIGDMAHIAVGTVLCGNVQIGKSTFVGANATIIQGRKIGEHCVIGAGEVVKRDTGDNETILSLT